MEAACVFTGVRGVGGPGGGVRIEMSSAVFAYDVIIPVYTR